MKKSIVRVRKSARLSDKLFSVWNYSNYYSCILVFSGGKLYKFSVLPAPNIMIGPTIHAIASGVGPNIESKHFMREYTFNQYD